MPGATLKKNVKSNSIHFQGGKAQLATDNKKSETCNDVNNGRRKENIGAMQFIRGNSVYMYFH